MTLDPQTAARGAAPHPPGGTFSPFLRQAQGGEKEAVRVVAATFEALVGVATRLRAEDRAEIDCQLERWTPELLARAALEGPAYMVELHGEPHAAFGATEHADGVWIAWSWGTPRMKRCVPAIARFCRERLGPQLAAAAARRIEARALAANNLGFRLLDRLGATRRALLPGHGRSGEDFFLFDWEICSCASTSSHPS